MNRTAKQQAMEDILEDLHRNHKSFIAFRRDLDPIMSGLVSDYLKVQRHSTSGGRNCIVKAGGQLVAHCFFSKATKSVEYRNYERYYLNNKQIL